MGSNDTPPSHIPPYFLPTSNLLLQTGGALWTICYILLTHESFKSKSYGMPLFALALNFAWELIYAFYVAESLLEKSVFMIWLGLDCVMVLGAVKFAKFEWSHPHSDSDRGSGSGNGKGGGRFVERNIGAIFVVMTTVCSIGHWTFAKWWIEERIGGFVEGKWYAGEEGTDTTALGFWSALVCQVYLSVASLAQLLVRQHSGGVSWSIWATRTFGSIIGFNINYAWCWYFWREAYEYFMSPFAVFLWVTGLVCDLIYPFVLWSVKKTEKVLEDGRKVAGDYMENSEGKKKQ